MPHATETTGTDTLVNGHRRSSSQFLSHLTSYPVVSDGIETFRSNTYGRKSLEIADEVYTRFGKPVEPYLETPYSYAKPYVTRADELADSGLGHVESHFPIVKEDTGAIVDKGKNIMWYPFRVADDGRNYVWTTWNDEYNKTAAHKDRGPGLSTSVLAIISTELKIASDFFQAVADFLGPKYEDSKARAERLATDARNTAGQYAQQAQARAEGLMKSGQDKADELRKAADEKVEHAQNELNSR